MLDETWMNVDTSRWVPFGVPRPRASVSLSGLDPASDGNDPSGVYSRNSFTIDSRLVIEA